MEDNEMPVVMTTGNGVEPPDFEVTLLELRPFRPFKSSEEYLYAMKEDLAEWLNGLYEGLDLDADNFLEQMETGVILCQHANNVVRKAREYYRSGNAVQQGDVPIPDRDVVYRYDVLPETFHARDNISNFISWCRSLSIKECLLFETDDLVLRKNERSFILCLLEVARKGVKFGMPAPLLVQLEQEIDAEIANDDDGYETVRQPQVVTNDLRSLHQRVVELLSRCTCPSQFPMIRVADGKYRIGDTKVLIFVRILRSHVMVRVGGGWDTLAHYLDKHDPCRCRAGHRMSTSAKLTMMQGKSSIPSMHVTYNRPTQGPSSTPSSPQSNRRFAPLTSPTPNRRFQQPSTSPTTPMRPLPRPCSDDDSSTSSLERKSPLKQIIRRSSSDEEEESEEDFQGRLSRRVGRKELILRDTVPSSWRYSPGIPRKEYQSEPALGNGQPRKISNSQLNSKLPSLTPRNKQPPKVGKVSPRIQNQQNWNDNRSHSSENLYHQEVNPSPSQSRNMMFHSRGASPIYKGRIAATERFVSENGFRRNDPKRHSSPRINIRPTENRTRLSPPKPPVKRNVLTTTVQNGNARRMFWSPERQQNNKRMLVIRKNSAPVLDNSQSPVIEKLKQHSDLCSDRNFLMKIEQLIAEFQAKTKMDDIEDFSSPTYTSLPVTLKEDLVDSKPSVHFDSNPVVHLPIQKSPVENSLGKSSSKIPLPIWYPKCQS